MREYSQVEQEIIARQVYQSVSDDISSISGGAFSYSQARAGGTQFENSELLRTLIDLESESKFAGLVRSIHSRIPRL